MLAKIRTLVYKMGFRPKLGTVLYSPSRDLAMAFEEGYKNGHLPHNVEVEEIDEIVTVETVRAFVIRVGDVTERLHVYVNTVNRIKQDVIKLSEENGKLYEENSELRKYIAELEERCRV